MTAEMATKTIAYLRTSSQIDVGSDKDSVARQPVAIERFAASQGLAIVDSFSGLASSRSTRGHVTS
jgi:hypothetical protein